MQFFLFLVFSVAIAIEVDDPDVIALTDSNFEEFVQNNEYVLAEFYAPWCGHCKNLAPEYAKAATQLKNRGSPAKLVKVDATQNQKIANKHNVQGYPTLKFFRNGEPSDYTGGRSQAEIVSWLAKKTLPLTRHLTTQEELDQFIASTETVIVAFLQSVDVAAWTKLAESDKFDGLVFGHVTDSDLFGDRHSGTVEVYREGEVLSDGGAQQALLSYVHRVKIQQRPKIYSEHWSKFLINSAFPLVDVYSDKVQKRAQTLRKALLIVFGRDVKEIALPVATTYKDTVIVATSTEMNHAANLGASGTASQTAVLTTAKGAQHIWNEDTEGSFNSESLAAFVEASLAGTYVSYVKSEPIPEDNTDAVTVLVGKTLVDTIKSGKNVFVEFYAPWCGHCKSLAPVWEELGEAYVDDPDVIIAKIDATANKIPAAYNVRGFPTLIFFNSKGKQYVHNGERDLKDLKKFVESKRTKVQEDKEDL